MASGALLSIPALVAIAINESLDYVDAAKTKHL